MARGKGPDPEYDDAELARRVSDAEDEIRRHVEELHDQGVIDLDAPAREVIDVIAQQFPQRPADSKEAGGQTATAAAQAGGYWLVGDQGWCNHLN
jgi:hypothetical protein